MSHHFAGGCPITRKQGWRGRTKYSVRLEGWAKLINFSKYDVQLQRSLYSYLWTTFTLGSTLKSRKKSIASYIMYKCAEIDKMYRPANFIRDFSVDLIVGKSHIDPVVHNDPFSGIAFILSHVVRVWSFAVWMLMTITAVAYDNRLQWSAYGRRAWEGMKLGEWRVCLF